MFTVGIKAYVPSTDSTNHFQFDVKQWLDTYCPPLSQRSALLAVIGSALCKCGQQVDTKTNLVFEASVTCGFVIAFKIIDKH